MFIYNIAIGAYHTGIYLAQIWSSKARAWIKGRKNQWQKMPDTTKRVVWFHASSLGEYEQGRPVMELWRKQHPTDYILLTFYSPSGFSVSHSDGPADYITYLPADGRRNAQKWYAHWDPAMAVFFKYDMWLHYVREARVANVPLGFISVLVRPTHFFTKPWAGFARRILSQAAFWACQDKASTQLLVGLNFQQVVCTGDTRVDRVVDLSKTEFANDVIETFTRNELVLMVGSSWQAEESMIVKLLQVNPDIKIVLAPHDVSEAHLKELDRRFSNRAIRYSSITNISEVRQYSVLVIDRIGWLSRLYRFADMAFIGGGFRKSVHNTLEPVAYRIPVAFGPRHKTFFEPGAFIALGVGHEVLNAQELIAFVDRYAIKHNRNEAARAADVFFDAHRGASEKNAALLNEILNKWRPNHNDESGSRYIQ